VKSISVNVKNIIGIIFTHSLITGILLLMGCAPANISDIKNTNVDEPAYAAEITESMLNALETEDYASFSRYFDDNMAESITENDFKEIHNITYSRVGSYVSKQFKECTLHDEYAVVYYRAEYSEDNAEVKVKIVFDESGTEPLVAGFWLDSTLTAD
jgi:hypothetical protein